MENRGAIQPAEVDQWVGTAAAGDSSVYAWGSDFPRFAPGVVAARKAAAEGLLTFTSRKRPSDGRKEYLMLRTAKRRREKADDVRKGYATAETADGIILQELRHAAAHSLPCPTNALLARKAGLPDEYAASYIVGKLKAAGKILVEHAGPGKRRVVTIKSSGARTRMEVAA